MIVAREAKALRLFTQPDHARFAGDLLALWRRDGMPEHPRRDELLLAVREHDNGWREADSAPRLDPADSRPADYRRLPRLPRFEIWRRGIERLAWESQYAALLVIFHALALHRSRTGDDWTGFLAELEDRRAELAATIRADEDTVKGDYAFLALCDRLSLAVCQGEEEHGRIGEYSFSVRGRTLELSPFPLAGATTFQVPSRQIADRAYGSETDLGTALATARWERTAVRVRPAAIESPGPRAEPEDTLIP